MECKQVVSILDQYRTGELDHSESEQVARHLASCAGCADHWQELRRLAESFAGLMRAAPEELAARIRDRVVDRYSSVMTDIGTVWVAFNRSGVRMTYLGNADAAVFEAAHRKRFGSPAIPGVLPERYGGAVVRAAAGELQGPVSIDLSALSGFEQKVLLLLKKVPHGEVRTYGWLARLAGSPAAVRAVGNTMARNPVPLLLPCHRVVPSSGGIGNYAFGASIKRRLLEHEGVPLEELEHCALENVRYLGCRTTGVFCFPTCRAARRIRPENRVLLRNLRAAERAGFHPCRICSPA
jgi:O-6-methylguanine DNA methyltransferase